jgi:heptaprenyl diphosphate synthase
MMPSANNKIAAGEEEIKKISLWVAIASVLQISESLIPHPIPGIRFGFANIVTLIILVNYTFSIALKVAILRTIVSSFMMGTFLSPAFFLSFFAALISTLVMGGLYRISTTYNQFYFSLVGISVLGAFTHNMAQLILAYFLLIKHAGIFVLLPWLSIGAVVMGLISGMIAMKTTEKLMRPRNGRLYKASRRDAEPTFETRGFFPGDSFLYRLKSETKILGVLLLAAIVLTVDSLWFHAFIFSAIIILAVASRISFINLFLTIKRLFLLVLTSFLLPIFFDDGYETIFRLGPIVVSAGALSAGALYSLRILVLLMISTLLVQTTSIEDMTMGLKNVLYPFKFFGIDPDKTGKIITLSWQWIPELWKEIRSMMKFLVTNKENKLRNLMDALTDLLIFLFQKEHP